MGKFANKEPNIWLNGKPKMRPWNGESDFAAMGVEVPGFRKTDARAHLKEMGFTDSEQMFRIVELMVDKIERDDPHGAMEGAYKLGLDATGVYRILAVLCSAANPEEAAEEKNPWVEMAGGYNG